MVFKKDKLYVYSQIYSIKQLFTVYSKADDEKYADIIKEMLKKIIKLFEEIDQYEIMETCVWILANYSSEIPLLQQSFDLIMKNLGDLNFKLLKDDYSIDDISYSKLEKSFDKIDEYSLPLKKKKKIIELTQYILEDNIEEFKKIIDNNKNQIEQPKEEIPKPESKKELDKDEIKSEEVELKDDYSIDDISYSKLEICFGISKTDLFQFGIHYKGIDINNQNDNELEELLSKEKPNIPSMKSDKKEEQKTDIIETKENKEIKEELNMDINKPNQNEENKEKSKIELKIEIEQKELTTPESNEPIKENEEKEKNISISKNEEIKQDIIKEETNKETSKKSKGKYGDFTQKEKFVTLMEQKVQLFRGKLDGMEIDSQQIEENKDSIEQLEEILAKEEGRTAKEERELYEEEKAKMEEWKEELKKQDEDLDEIGDIVSQIKHEAKLAGENIKSTHDTIKRVDQKTLQTTKHVNQQNKKLKDLIQKLRSGDKLCLDIILILLGLGLVAVLYNLF